MNRPLTRRRFLAGLGVAAAAVALPMRPAEAGARRRFVRREGTRLTLGDRPWYLYGASTYGTSTYGTLNPGGLARSREPSRSRSEAGLNCLRLVNFFDERGLDPEAPYDPAAWARVDAMLDAMRTSRLRAILDLAAYRNHLHNLTLETGSDVTPYRQDWSRFIRFVAKRENTVNGIAYRRDPTIAIGSFAGEPNPPNSQEPLKPTTQELTDFYARVFAEWREWDRRHLLSCGGLLHVDWEEAFGNPNGSGIDWQAIFALPEHDVPSIHSYWHNFPATAATDYRSPKVSEYCAQIKKPWITEEFGFLQQPVDSSTDPDTVYTESDRADWFQTTYDIQAAPSPTGAPAAGVAFWNLGTEVSPLSHDVNPDTLDTWATVLANAPA